MTRYRGRGKRERYIVMTFFLAGLLAGGCDISHVVGSIYAEQSDGAGAGGIAGQGGQMVFNVDAGFPGNVVPLGAIQSWTGSLESYQFASGSNAVTVSFATDPSGVVVGTVTLGSGSPPPPATDPNATYPPGASQVLPNTVVEGFPYTIARGTLAGSRLGFTIWETEVWSGWCALQTPNPYNPSCLPYGTSCESDAGCSYPDPLTGDPVSIGSAKVTLCNRDVCVCTSGVCGSSFWYGAIEFDVALSGTAGSGSASFVGDMHMVTLTKDP
jgi:hypothetical protein